MTIEPYSSASLAADFDLLPGEETPRPWLTRANVDLKPATADALAAAVADSDSDRSRMDTIDVAIRAFPWLLARARAGDLTVVRDDGQIERVVPGLSGR